MKTCKVISGLTTKSVRLIQDETHTGNSGKLDHPIPAQTGDLIPHYIDLGNPAQIDQLKNGFF